MAFLKFVGNTGGGGDDKDSVKHQKKSQAATQANSNFDDGSKERVTSSVDRGGYTAKSGIYFIGSTSSTRSDKSGVGSRGRKKNK